ncbi:MAG: homoserine kinase [Burkholderiales bacterium]|nr:MAG: homoserine kinase [Burkholderiales bacterium]
MAVFTPVSRDELAHWLERYHLGELRDFEGIASGIENSNFFVTTSAGRFVLTLFERLAFDELPFYLGLMHHLAARGVPCPDPVADRRGALLGRLNGKPAALVTRLEGRAVLRPTAAHCARVGALLATMHRAAIGYESSQPNLRGLDWWARAAPQVMPFLDADQAALLRDELAQQQEFARTELHASLPSSAVHADLFRDNVLFESLPDGTPRLGGVIDFYFAGVDSWMFDLAVAANDWCIDDASGDFDAMRLASLLDAYRAERAPDDAERSAWPMMLRSGALRFWLSRLHDLHLPRPAQMVTPKDPAHFERILRARRAGVPALA